jgi:hypothetical protein
MAPPVPEIMDTALYTVRMNVRKIWWGAREWIFLGQDMDQWRALGNTALNLKEFHKILGNSGVAEQWWLLKKDLAPCSLIVSQWLDCATLNGKMIGEWWIRKYLERSSYDLVGQGDKENHETPIKEAGDLTKIWNKYVSGRNLKHYHYANPFCIFLPAWEY